MPMGAMPPVVRWIKWVRGPPADRVTDAAKSLGVSRNALSELVNERRGISPEMAIRLAKAFGSSAAVWAGMQLDYDMARAMEHADRIKVQRVSQPAAGA